MVTIIAWIAILLAGNLSNIIWREVLRAEAPLWVFVARIVALVVLVVAATTIPQLRPLHGYLLALAAATAGHLITDLIYTHQGVTAWIAEARWRDAVIVSSTLKLIPVALMALTVIGLHRKEVFLVKGDLGASGRVPFLNATVPWTLIGPIVIVVFVALLALILSAVLRPDFGMLWRAAALLPVILVFSALNAFNEEFLFRSVLLARASPVVGGEQALWLTSINFGLGHWFGNPRGPIGVIGATALGLMLGKSMLETGGFLWAWAIHALLDVVIFTFLIMAAAR